MSLVDTETGEVVQMDESTARDLVDSIRRAGERMWQQIVRAFQGRAWIALGYSSWDEMCEHEFDGARIKLPREERREVVASLSDAGMSTRAIGAAIGVSDGTVRNDMKPDAGAQSYAPADPDDAITDAEIVEDVGPVDHKPITGLDGKTYPKPEPKPSPKTPPDRTRAAVAERRRLIREMAADGHTSHQIAKKLNLTVESLRAICRAEDITIVADKTVGRTHGIDQTQVIENTIGVLEGVAASIESLVGDVSSLDTEKRLEWIEALRQPLAVINRFKKELSS